MLNTPHEKNSSSGKKKRKRPGKSNQRNKISAWIKTLVQEKPDTTLREAIGEYIEQPAGILSDGVSAREKILLSNILDLGNITVANIMVPRADIVAIDINTSDEELMALLAEKQYSRLPVYRGTLDEVLGTIHIKDIMVFVANKQPVEIPKILTNVPIVSPSMPVLSLLIEMQNSERHIVLVVDEYGGIDGLVTINDVIESIIGEIDDEHTSDAQPEVTVKEDGTAIVDGRVSMEEFEARFGAVFSEEERETSDTLAGLVFSIAGRVPARGEILTHRSGMIFEVMDADPRRIIRMRLRNIPAH